MARRKLTLSIEEAAVRKARRFSERHQTTISQLVTDFLSSLEDDAERAAPIVVSLRGLLPASVSRDDHREYLRRKHRA